MTDRENKGIDEHSNPGSDQSGFENLVDELPLGILSCDREGNITAVNNFLLDILGSPSAEATRKVNMLTFPPLVESGISATVEKALTTGINASIETPYTSKWGKELFMSFRAFPLKDEQGLIYGCHAIVEDLTARKRVDAEIVKNKLKDSLISKISDRFINSNLKGIDEDINRTLKDLAEFIGADRATLFSTDDGTDFLVKTHEWHAHGVISTIPLNEKWDYKKLVLNEFNDLHIINIPDVSRMPEERKDAKMLLQELGIRSIAMILISHHGLFKGFISVDCKEDVHICEEKDHHVLKIAGNMIASIIERRNTEKLMLENEQEYEDIIDSLDAIVWKATFDEQGNAIKTNIFKPMDNMLGFPEGTIGTDWECYFAHIHPDDMQEVQNKLKLAFANPKTPVDVEYRILSDEGKMTWVNSLGSSHSVGDGIYQMVGTTSNITERKIVDEKIAQSESLLNEMGEIAKIGAWTLDVKSNTVTWTPEVANIQELDDLSDPTKSMELFKPESKEKLEKALNDVIEKAESYDLELELVSAKGNHKWVRSIGKPIIEDGNISKITGTLQDITELKRAEVKLRESEQKLRLFIEQVPVSLIMLDRDMKNIAVSPTALNYYSIDNTEVIGKDHYDVFSAIDNEYIRSIHQRALKGEVVRKEEDRFDLPDGTTRWGRWEVRPWKASDGSIGGIIIFFEDITERKQAHDKLRESEEKLRQLIEHAPAALAMFDRDMRYMAASHRWLSIFHPDGMDITGMNHYDVFPPIDNDYYKAIHQRALKGEVIRKEEDCVKLPNGDIRWSRWEVRPWKAADGTIGGIIIITEDITKRKNAEIKLRENEEMMGLLIEHAPIALAMFDRKMRYIAASRRWLTDYHLGDIDIVGKCHYDIFPEIPDEWKDMHRRTLKGEAIPVEETRFERVDGRVQWVRGAVHPWRKADGTIGGIVLLSEDITERKEAEEGISRSETKYRSLFEQSTDSIMIHDFDGKIVDVNKSACEIFGYTKDELKQKSIIELVIPEEREEVIEKTREIQSKGSIRNETRMMKANGDILYMDVSASVLHTQKNLIQAVGRDITGRIEAEEAMLTAKIEAETASRTKSDFLANMSHELRTPLNSIIGFSDVMIDGMAGEIDAKQKHYLQNISESGHHLLKLINDILDISKIEAGKMELNFDMMDIPSAISEIIAIMHPLTSEKNLTVELDLPDDLPEVMADRSKIKQILYNLIGNAVKFTENDGMIAIRAEVKDNDMQISIIDTGIGISQIDQKKLFKPFSQIDSSISRKYEGTGLGLALVKDIVELHGGMIWVKSEVGKGSSFTLKIPIYQTN